MLGALMQLLLRRSNIRDGMATVEIVRTVARQMASPGISNPFPLVWQRLKLP